MLENGPSISFFHKKRLSSPWLRPTHQSAHFSRMVAYGAVGLAIAGYVSCVISLPPLVIQVQQRNLACCVLIISIFTINIMYATNALIWHSNNHALWWDGRIYCDIQVRLQVALQVAVLGAATCVFRQLSLVFHPSLCLPTKAQIRRTKLIEFTLCFALPVFRMSAVYLVQPERYWIYRISGCTLSVDTSWPSYVLIHSWELVISIAGLVFAAITTTRMVHHRRSTSSILGRGQNRRNESRIIRLYCFGLILFLTFVPLQIYVLYYALPRHLEPYSWSRIHPPDWSERIFRARPSSFYGRRIIVQCLSVFYSIGIAILVGMAPDAVDSYKGWVAQFHVWWRRLSKRRSTTVHSGNDLLTQHENSTQVQAVDRYEFEAWSINRQDQEAL